MRRNARVDANQMMIAEGLREQGRSVAFLHTVGDGFPDMLVGYQGRNFLFEVKASVKSKLTPKQIDFFSNWKGQKAIITDLAKALEITANGSSLLY